MGSPAHNTGHSEDRRINFLRQTNHLIDEAAIEVEVGASWLAAATMLLQALDTLLLYELQEVVLILSALLIGKFASQSLQLRHEDRSRYTRHGRYHR